MAAVLVTGAAGFVGRHLIPALKGAGHRVVAVGRSGERMSACRWLDDVEKVEADVLAASHRGIRLDEIDWLVHLAWPSVHSSASLEHFDLGLTGSWRFIRACVEAGVSRVMVSGTCLEYGMRGGEMSASEATDPTTAYGIAKDTLRRQLQCLQRVSDFGLVWARIFYMYGEGQSPRSLLPSLDRAIDQRKTPFPMSPGDQLRDFIEGPEAGAQLAALLDAASSRLTIANVCTGNPISVRAFVEEYLRRQPWAPQLDLGALPYSDHEPKAFWGSRDVLRSP